MRTDECNGLDRSGTVRQKMKGVLLFGRLGTIAGFATTGGRHHTTKRKTTGKNDDFFHMAELIG